MKIDPSAFAQRVYQESQQLQAAMTGVCYDSRVIEVGCGYGRMTPWIRDMSGTVVSIDKDESNIQRAKEMYTNSKFYTQNTKDIVFVDDSFDSCVSWRCLETMNDADAVKSCSEIERVCNGEGLIILGESSGDNNNENVFNRSPKEYENMFDEYEIAYSEYIRDVQDPYGSSMTILSHESDLQ